MAENKTTVDKVSFSFGLVAGIALVSAIMLIAGGLPGGGGKVAGDFQTNTYVAPTGGGQPTAQPSQPVAANVLPIQSGEYLRGNADATVDIIEYSDFECPYCLRHLDSIERILSEYGDRVRLAYRHFPLTGIHPQAQKAAEASECAGEQGRFWEMHDAIFEASANKTMSVSKWKETAGGLGLNASQFNTCLDSGQYAAKVSKQAAEGAAAGVQGTPATFVNGQLLSGAVPYEQLQALVEANL